MRYLAFDGTIFDEESECEDYEDDYEASQIIYDLIKKGLRISINFSSAITLEDDCIFGWSWQGWGPFEEDWIIYIPNEEVYEEFIDNYIKPFSILEANQFQVGYTYQFINQEDMDMWKEYSEYKDKFKKEISSEQNHASLEK